MVQDHPIPGGGPARSPTAASPSAPLPAATPRLTALHGTGLLDTPAEEAFDRLTGLAARLLGAPVALVSLVADDRQFFKSAVGLPEPWASSRTAPAAYGFDPQVVRSAAPLVVGDTRNDPVTRYNPAVRELGWLAYAGVPLVTGDGHTVGAMSVVDVIPRLWSERDLALLRDLAASAVTEIELRAARRALAERAPDEDPALRDSEERYRLAARAARHVVWDWDLVTNRVTWGEGMDARFGYPEAALGTTAGWWYERIHPEDRERVVAELHAALARGDRTWELEYRFRQADGAYAHVVDCGYVSHDADGVPVRMVGAITAYQDLARRKAKEEAVWRTEDQLRHAQKMEAVGRLAGGVAHDFNNLLTGILSYCDLILQELRANEPIRGDVEQIRHAGLRAAGLTRQLLAFSRRQVLQPRVLSLNDVVIELDTTLRRLLGLDVVLEAELDPGLWHVLADRGQLEQVLVNLVSNARDAMPHGGRVAITTANLRLDPATATRLNGARAGDYVVLTVGDSGVGMDAATQTRVFDPFFTTKEPGKGRGLGLATVYGIMEQSGGRITVESAPGQGSTFAIYLPRHHVAPAPAPGARPDRRALPQGTETLLLVEDEAAVRDSARRLLERHGYTVLEARHGAEALRIFEANEAGIDLVLTDVVMPEMGGRELVERLRTHRPTLKVLYMSGYTEKAIAPGGIMPAGTGFVEKPFTLEALIRRVREVLDG